MTALTHVLSQYLRGESLWDGATTMATIRRIVASGA